MEKITPKMRKEYVEGFGSFCPFCESENIEGEETDYGSGEIWQRIFCFDCGEIWTDIYRLIGVEQYER